MTRDKKILPEIRRSLRRKLYYLSGEWRPLIEPRVASEVIAKEMKAASIPTISFFVLLALSASIATFGLLANSAPAIIGAMIVAPLMTPIMGLAYGIVEASSWKQVIRSTITVFLGVVVVIGISFFSARFMDIRIAGTEMLNRAFPSLLDLGVAMAAGAAGAYSLSRESIRNSIAGVAIAVALVPPLAVVGIGLALGRRAAADVGLSFSEVGLFSGGTDIAVGAFVLFLTNLAAIVVVAGTVMTMQGYGNWRRGIFSLAGVIAVSILLLHPLGEGFHKLHVKSMTLRLLRTLPVTHPNAFVSTVDLDTLRLYYENGLLHIHAMGQIDRDDLEGRQARLDLFRRELEEELGEPVMIEVKAIPVEIVRYHSGAAGDKVPDPRPEPADGE